jgi:hypothetical protein
MPPRDEYFACASRRKKYADTSGRFHAFVCV